MASSAATKRKTRAQVRADADRARKRRLLLIGGAIALALHRGRWPHLEQPRFQRSAQLHEADAAALDEHPDRRPRHRRSRRSGASGRIRRLSMPGLRLIQQQVFPELLVGLYRHRQGAASSSAISRSSATIRSPPPKPPPARSIRTVSGPITTPSTPITTARISAT